VPFNARRRRVSVGVTALASVFALAASLLVVSPASAAVTPPSGLSPAAAGSDPANTSGSPVLTWVRAGDGSKYDVQVASDPTFAALRYSSRTSNTKAVPTSLLPAGLTYWRVRTVSSSNATSAWADASFTVTATAPPMPQAPENNGVALDQPDNAPLLSWSAVTNAVLYQVDVDTDGDFVNVSTYTTKGTSLVVPDPKAGGSYQWRVRAKLSSGLYTEYSETWKYTIGSLSGVQIVAPKDDETQPVEDVTLEWQPVDGAKTYDLLVSTDQDFNTIVDSKTGLKGTRYSPTNTYLNNQYYWKVRARNNLGETIDWSQVAVHNFKRQWPQQPVLEYPKDQFSPAVGGDFYYQWTAVPHATRYRLDVGTDPNFSPGTYNTCYTAGTTYTAGVTGANGGSNDRCFPSEGYPTYWKVMALDDPSGVGGLYSSVGKFIYDSGLVRQVGPADGATVAVPTMSWQASRGAEKYRVTFTDSSGRKSVQDTYALSFTPTGTTGLDPTKSPYRWTVQSLGANGSLSPLPSGWSFTVAGTPATHGLAPLTPIDGNGGPAQTRFPALSWEPMPGAAYYAVKIGLAGTGYWLPSTQSEILRTNYPYPAATDHGKGLLAPGSYVWQVTAYDKNNNTLSGADAPVGTFTIADLAVVTGQQIALTGTSLDANKACTAYLDDPRPGPTKCEGVPATPVLDWQPVPGAAFYMVYVGQDREFTNMVYTGVPTVNTRWTPDWDDRPVALSDSQAGQAYYWFIRPCKAVNVCAPDPLSTSQSATNAFNKQSPEVQLVSPDQGAAVPASDGSRAVYFSWTDYLATNLGAVYEYSPGVAEGSRQAAKQYHIQVSTSASFASPIDDRYVDQTTYAPYDRTYPEGTLYWQVQAVDAAGNGLTWSQAGRFVKKASPVPTPKEPADGASTGGTTAFRWSPADGAGSYQLEVYKNDDTNWSDVNRVVTYTSKQTAYAPDSPLPASDNAYVWRVRRLDADGRPGQWSSTSSFYSRGSVPTLDNPAANSQLPGYGAYFTWKPVAGAVSYLFERKVAGAQSNAESVTTAALAWAPTSPLGSGDWSWRVTALDVNRNAIGASDWQDFTVDNDKGLFNPLAPRRVMDTRSGLAVYKSPVRAGQTITLTIPGLPASATAVALNVTATNPTASSFLTVFPYGGTRPTASNLNFSKGQTVPNMVTVAVGSGGRLSFYNFAGSVDVLADLAGYYTPEGGSGFTPQAPARVMDTRIGLGAPKARVKAGQTVTLTVPGLPANATAVAMNVTAAMPTSSGFLTVYPADQARPTTSNLNFLANQIVPNLVVVAVGSGGKLAFYNRSGTVDVIADLAGYFAPDTGSLFKGNTPKRVLDTRYGIGARRAQVGPGAYVTLTIPGLPVGTTAVALNVTATNPTAGSFATVYPSDRSRPTASNLNFIKGQTVPNMVTVSVGAGGQVSLFNAYGSVDLIADLAGAYTSR
jgi:hypothetical protein